MRLMTKGRWGASGESVRVLCTRTRLKVTKMLNMLGAGSRIQRVNWVGGAQEPLEAEKYVVAYVFLTIPGPEAVHTLPS